MHIGDKIYDLVGLQNENFCNTAQNISTMLKIIKFEIHGREIFLIHHIFVTHHN